MDNESDGPSPNRPRVVVVIVAEIGPDGRFYNSHYALNQHTDRSVHFDWKSVRICGNDRTEKSGDLTLGPEKHRMLLTHLRDSCTGELKVSNVTFAD